MCERRPRPPQAASPPLTAVADLRDTVTARGPGQPATGPARLPAIDPQSWQVIAERLRTAHRPLV